MLVTMVCAALAAELEVVVYDDELGEDLIVQQYQDPESLTWPQTYGIMSTGSVKVYEASAASGMTRFCVDYRASSSAVWNTTCTEAQDSDDLVYGVSWKLGRLAVGVYLDTSSAFSGSLFLDSGSFPGASSSCSITCDDSTNCSANCPNAGCHAECVPSAHCQCL